MKRCVRLPRRCLSNVSCMRLPHVIQADHKMAMSHQPLLQDTISSMRSSNIHPRRNNTIPRDKCLSRPTPHRILTKASNPALPHLNTNLPNSLKRTLLIHPITLPRTLLANHSMHNTRTSRVQELTVSHPELPVIHLMNLIAKLPNLEQREWALETNQQLGRLIIDNKLNRGTKSLSKESTRLSMVLHPTHHNSNKVKDLIVMDMGMCLHSKGQLME